MLAIPLPFVMSFILLIIALFLKVKQPVEGKLATLFMLICAVSTALVGLRWTFDVSFFRFIQPIIASLIPVSAWFCFARAHQANSGNKQIVLAHLIGPLLVTLSAIFYQIWLEMTDILLVVLYLIYGILLIRSSCHMPEAVRLSQVENVLNAERVAGFILLTSAAVDAALSIDFIFYGGAHVTWMLSLSYLVLIPIVVIAVLKVALNTSLDNKSMNDSNRVNSQFKKGSGQSLESPISTQAESTGAVMVLTEDEAQEVFAKLDHLMQEKAAFRDPDLTLSRLSRKLGIPARQISMAVNQICQQNISKVLNEYRIKYAQQQLMASQKTIAEIYLESGFQSKSNFNREFSRIVKQTPSEFRRVTTGGEKS